MVRDFGERLELKSQNNMVVFVHISFDRCCLLGRSKRQQWYRDQ